MEQDFLIGHIFMPLSRIIFDWVGIQIPAFTLLVLVVVALGGLGLFVMKKV
jgi:hypothetical protein